MFEIKGTQDAFTQKPTPQEKNEIVKRNLWEKDTETSSFVSEIKLEENLNLETFDFALQAVDDIREGMKKLKIGIQEFRACF